MKYLLWLAFRQLLPSPCEFRIHVPDTCVFLETQSLITSETVGVSDHTPLKVFLLTACFQLLPWCGGSEYNRGAGLWTAPCGGVWTPGPSRYPVSPRPGGGWDSLPAVWVTHNSRVKVGLLRTQLSVSLELKSRWGFPCGSAGKEWACNAGDLGLTSGLGTSPGEAKGSSLQYSGLEKSMDCMG